MRKRNKESVQIMKPALLIMAAGMGSRYGGLKQIDPIGPNGEVIIDYSLYDAKRAGFSDVYFIIKHEIENDFKEVIERGIGKHMNVHYIFQEVEKLPEGFEVPEGRTKPWGTGHAVMMAKDIIKAPFAVLNADDYYGPEGFKTLFDYLSNAKDTDVYDYCMIGFKVKNTITDNGSVSRGVCETDANGNLIEITERTKIQTNSGKIQFLDDDETTWVDLHEDTIVSMNMFGFTPSILDELSERFPSELKEIIANNPQKGEYFLPKIVGELIDEHKATVKVLPTSDKWYGITYKEDKPDVVSAMKEKINSGLYPEKLWY